MTDIHHVIQVNFDCDRTPPLPIDKRWLDLRFDLFHKLTLSSILNQPRHDDFEVWLMCGKSHQEYTSALPWHEKVHLIYDGGKARIAEIDTPWVSVSRIDSDDLYHEAAFDAIRQEVQRRRDPKKVVSFMFHRNVVWNQIYGFIGRHDKLCKIPPFITRICPRGVYRDSVTFREILFVPHGWRMRSLLKPVMLDDLGRHCIVTHGVNTNRWKRGLDPVVFDRNRIEDSKKSGAILTEDPKEIVQMLAEYGISREYALDRSGWRYVDGRFQGSLN